MSRSVILVVIDCLRADHVSAMGYHRATTPGLDRMAADGVLWEQAYSTSSWTKPSVTSMLTGQYPTQHGSFEGIKRSKGRLTVTTDRLSSDEPTLAERFAAAGWRCGAFMNNAQLGPFTGLNRGFDCYVPDAGKADRLIERFLEWRGAERDRPAFAYLHLLEAHWPYKPRRRHVEMFGGNRDANFFRDFNARDFGRLRRAISHGEAVLSIERLREMIQMYDGAVRRLDGKIAAMRRSLEEIGLLDQSAMFVTADHGEEFLEHGGIGHGQSLYEELTHVPLIGVFPGAPRGSRISTPVSHVDLADTLLHIAGIESPEHDLLKPGGTRAVVSELRIRRKYTQTFRSGDWKLHRRFTFAPENGTNGGYTSLGELLESTPHEVRHELYDLANDAAEASDLSDRAEDRETLERLGGQLDGWRRETVERATAGEVEIDDSVVRHLRALGYID